MQGIIANLERIGLLHRVSHPTHGRILRTELTKVSSKTLAKAHIVLAGVEETMTSELNGEEIERVRLLLLRCVESSIRLDSASCEDNGLGGQAG